MLEQEELMRDLAHLELCERMDLDHLPIIHSYLGQVGYFMMPSARVPCDGNISLGAVTAAPYHNYWLDFQLFDRLEVSGVYRIFNGFKDPLFGDKGFGDFSERGANFKLTLARPEDTDYRFPGIAVGIEDFFGSQRFNSKYIVATQVIPEFDLEWTLGWGWGRIKGLFSGIAYSPYRNVEGSAFQGLSLVAEYDANDYKNPKREPHPNGVTQSSPFNVGLVYRTCYDNLQLNFSSIRGNQAAAGITFSYPLGTTTGIVPKCNDPPCYSAPCNVEPIGCNRSLSDASADLAFAFDVQGFTLMEVSLGSCHGKRVLRLELVNRKYRHECVVHRRINYVLAMLAPSNIHEIVVVMSAESVLCHEYRYRREDLFRFQDRCIDEHELSILSSYRDVTPPLPNRVIVYERESKKLEALLLPTMQTFFGSASGKFKYEIDLEAWFGGYVWENVYYQLILSSVVHKTTGNVGDRDLLNPSQLLNVHSDYVNYYNQTRTRVEEGWLQKSWNLNKGLYARAAIGLFNIAYGGIGGELLYYPVGSQWAFGAEMALLRKRNYSGYGFQEKIRKWVGTEATYVPYFLLPQCFFNIYYDFVCMPLSVKWSVGQFLAQDFGLRTEVFRYFPSGLTISLWYTITNGNDKVNGSTYFDRGISFSFPLDIVFKESSRTRWGYGMSAWLRDVGYRIDTGFPLYPILFEERY